MEFNVSALSDRQLCQLMKQIEAEKKLRSDPFRYKASLYALLNNSGDDYDSAYIKYDNAFTKTFASKCKEDGEDRFDPAEKKDQFHDIEDSVFKLCDLACGNYAVKLNKEGKWTAFRSGSRIMVDDSNDYIDMYKELFAVIDKHLFKEDK